MMEVGGRAFCIQHKYNAKEFGTYQSYQDQQHTDTDNTCTSTTNNGYNQQTS